MRSVKLKRASFLLALLCPNIHCWGIDGHTAVCRIAQSRLNDGAIKVVKQLLPEYAEGDLGSVCSWADHVKFHYRWSSPLHYINVPDSQSTFQYNNNLTEALLFLSHFLGDIHQPLHVGHVSDKGGNTIDVHWYTSKTVLHHVWDDSIIETEEQNFYNSSVHDLVDAIKQNITNIWADQISEWENCSQDKLTCPNIYAVESIEAACNWAYKDVDEGSILEDNYFFSRLPIANIRLAQAGVRLAATLNRVFA